jgi:hypothetical protein
MLSNVLVISFEKNFYKLPFTAPSLAISFNWYQSRFRSFKALTSLRSKDGIPRIGIGSYALRCEELPDVAKTDGRFLCGKGQILSHVTVNTAYVHLSNFLALGSRDMFDANNKAVDHLFRARCQSEFHRVQTEDLAYRISEHLKDARGRNAQVQDQIYATYLREYKNFSHLPSESADALFQWFTDMVNNMIANLVVLPYDDHDRPVKLLQSLDRTVWMEKSRLFLSPTSMTP